MSDIPNQIKKRKLPKLYRQIHRITGISLILPFLILSLSGILLGWKKQSTWIQAANINGTSRVLTDWLPLDSLHKLAVNYLHAEISPDLSTELDRIDVRKKHGIIKFNFSECYWSIHLDGATGALLQLERRRSDFIEHLHDGSIIDRLLGTTNGQFKLLYMTLLGMALLLFLYTGFWLWYWRLRNINGNSGQSRNA